MSNAAEAPCPAGDASSHTRMAGCERSGGVGALPGFARTLSRIFSDDSLKPSTGAPATMRSASAIVAAVASAVESARASGLMPSAVARAIRAVFPHSDSYTTTAFTLSTFPQSSLKLSSSMSSPPSPAGAF